MFDLERIAERRIAEAVERGELDDLPGAGRPLVLDDDRNVPPEMRMAWRVLRNAGLAPEGVTLRRELADAQVLVDELSAGPERSRAVRRLDLLRARLGAAGSTPGLLAAEERYRYRLLDRMARDGTPRLGKPQPDEPESPPGV